MTGYTALPYSEGAIAEIVSLSGYESRVAALLDSEGRTVIMGARKLSAGAKRRTTLGLALEQGAKEIPAHVKGEAKLPTRRIVLPDEVDVKRIRTKAGMSQAEFALAFCINKRTLQDWERGRRKPDTTTRAYLAVIAKNREAVLEALAS